MKKEYKTSEMMAMLEKNPKLKFESSNTFGKETFHCDDGYLLYTVFSGNGNPIPEKMGGGKFNGNFILNTLWQLVRQPVTWQEAIQAWAEGKTIKCVVPQKYSNGTRDIEFVFQCEDFLIDNNEEPPYKNHFEHGTWFIEDGEA